ncbi:MAG: multi-sensor signal transduction histidine kinase [Ramlibacter sp.]|nr:multi-sensor signal transduction histidine kinase [Ramlibacter sp.]
MSTPSPPDIVVIEDDSIMREALTDWLEAAGYGVRNAVDGCAGLEAVRCAEPALVVTDMHMPRTDGWGVIAELRRRHPAVPVIAISGHVSAGRGVDIDATLALGASRVLVKPFKRVELLLAVADLLRG